MLTAREPQWKFVTWFLIGLTTVFTFSLESDFLHDIKTVQPTFLLLVINGSKRRSNVSKKSWMKHGNPNKFVWF